MKWGKKRKETKISASKFFWCSKLPNGVIIPTYYIYQIVIIHHFYNNSWLNPLSSIKFGNSFQIRIKLFTIFSLISAVKLNIFTSSIISLIHSSIVWVNTSFHFEAYRILAAVIIYSIRVQFFSQFLYLVVLNGIHVNPF